MNTELKQQIGQMIIVRTTGHLFDEQIRYPLWEANSQQLQYLLAELNVGGVILLGGSATEVALRSRQLQSWAKTPLLLAADIEEGVGQRFEGASWFPPPMALGSVSLEKARDYARKMGEITAQEALAVGLNWILSPVVDVNNNPDNPVINVRAFGENPETVSELATAFLEGCQQYPILTVAKHFPGHGDTATDSHLSLPVIPHCEERLQEIEIPPFQAAIAKGVDSVMTAHLLIPAWDPDSPATLSYRILTEKLRQGLGFEGIIITDALIMAGVAKFAPEKEVYVRAIEAGADILLMPEHPELAIDSVYEAVQQGRISQKQIAASVARIRQAKAKVAPSWQFAPPLESLQNVASAAAQGTVKEILTDSMQQGGKVPLSPIQGAFNLVVVNDLLNIPFLGAHTPAVMIPKGFGYETQVVEQHRLDRGQLEAIAQPILLQLFIRGNPFTGTAGLTENARFLLKSLLKNGQLQALVIYGSPYILDWFRSELPPELPWVLTYGQMPAAQSLACKVLFPYITEFSKEQVAFT